MALWVRVPIRGNLSHPVDSAISFCFLCVAREIVGSNCLRILFIDLLTARSLISVEPLMDSVFYFRMLLVSNAELLITNSLQARCHLVTPPSLQRQSQSSCRRKTIVKVSQL